jgi:hypothetical protein
VHSPLPFSGKDYARSDYDRYLARFYCPLAGGLWGSRTVEKTLAVAIEVPKQVSLH